MQKQRLSNVRRVLEREGPVKRYEWLCFYELFLWLFCIARLSTPSNGKMLAWHTRNDQSTTSQIVIREHSVSYLESQPPINLIKALIISEDLSWSVNVHGYTVNATKCCALGDVPDKI